MNKYQNGKIYKIVSSQTDQCYVGSTIQTLKRRLHGHYKTYKRKIKGIENHNHSSFKIIQYQDSHIVLLENYPCNNKKELETRERFYIENLNSCNKYIPTRTPKEWFNDNKEHMYIYKKEWVKNNPDKVYNKWDTNKDKIQKWRSEHKEQIRYQSKKCYEKNKEKHKEKKKEYRIKNKEKISETNKKRYENKKDEIKKKDAQRRYYQNTWGGNRNYHNNLLKISLDIFK